MLAQSNYKIYKLTNGLKNIMRFWLFLLIVQYVLELSKETCMRMTCIPTLALLRL